MMHLKKGGMCSGKSEWILTECCKFEFAKKKVLTVQAFIKEINSLSSIEEIRNEGISLQETIEKSDQFIKSRSGAIRKCLVVSCLSVIPIIKLVEFDVIALDEAQFFNEDTIPLCYALVNHHKKIIKIACLDQNFMRNAFPFVIKLEVYCIVERLYAMCECGNIALHSFRIPSHDEYIKNIPLSNSLEFVPTQPQKEKYIPVCSMCYDINYEKYYTNKKN